MNRMQAKISAKIALTYAVVSGLWIVFSDRLLSYFISDPGLLTQMQTVKGGFFIIATAIILYCLIYKNLTVIGEADYKLRQKHEELMAAEEELRQQFEEILKTESRSRRQNECLVTLHELALIFMRDLKAEELAEVIVQKAVRMGAADEGLLYLYDYEDGVLKLSYETIKKVDSVVGQSQLGGGVVGKVWSTGQTQVIYNYNSWEERQPDPVYDKLKTVAAVPLKTGDQIIGVFGIGYCWNHTVSDDEMLMLNNFAEMVAIALAKGKLRQQLDKNQARTRALIDAFPDFIFRASREGIFLDYKQSPDFIAYFNQIDKIGKNLVEFTPPYLYEKIMHGITQALDTRSNQQFEYEIEVDGRLFQREMRIVACGDQEIIGIIRDITESKMMENQLRYMSLYDKITGVYNRFYFEEELRLLNDSRYLPVSIVAFDIDGLKLVNDTLGHAAGDQLLVTAATIIKRCFREGDIIARTGGDEFAVLLPNTELAVAEHACRCIRDAASQYRDKEQLPLSISLGMSIRTNPEETLSETFKAAENKMYREKLHRTQSARSAIVQTLATALEARDFVTDGHADRLQDLMEQLAVAVGLPESALPDLRLLGRFHDIGKVGIPDNILFKPGRLTPEEYEIMKRHCEIGHRIAQASPELAPIADWILKHQEWWNGQGYPLGLAGEDIPLACRILSIVDAYDAMTNDRPYRSAMSREDAIAELERCAGRQFDERLVRVFVEIVKNHQE
jgi:diguanylate cyclase (GGDEF)-like protein/PAS domain S-box-containing protein